jgi:NAD(P)-dependent dehydrogenase (short-subunit alcohol dehydrogenase family)
MRPPVVDAKVPGSERRPTAKPTAVNQPSQEKEMEGRATARTAVITGASSGMGLFAAKALAAQGWRVIALGRNRTRTERAEAEIHAAALPGVVVNMIRADLALMSDVVRAAKEISATTDRVDVLLNNAGGTAAQQTITSECNEATFAGNHLGHFLLTTRLLPLLRAAADKSAPGDTRIINVSSSAHESSPGLQWDDLQMFDNFVPMRAYCNAKLANILFTTALSKRLAGTGIVVHAMHPGAVSTNFWSHADEATQRYAQTKELISTEQGADTLVWLATAAEPGKTSGGYYYQRKQIPASAAAQDGTAAERLWAESEKLVAKSCA